MAKKEKVQLTPEEIADRKIRRSNGWTRFWAIFLSFAIVAGVFAFARFQGLGSASSDETTTTVNGGAANASNSSSWDDGSSNGGSSNNASTPASSDNAGSSDAPASDASEAKTVADALNSATKAVVDSKAGYDWARKCEYTTPIDVGNATGTLNKVIHMVDENADLNSVVGGFLGVGDKKLTIKKGEDAAAAIDYHGTNYALKATSLKPEDLKGLKVDGDSFEFTLDNVTTPAKDGSNSLSRFTNDIITKDEVEAEIKAQVSVVTVNSLDGEYTNIKVKGTITDGKLVSLEYETSTSAKLALKALGIGINGSGAIHTTASYKNFVY